MAKPVIFDDGGSLRIRELDNGKTMDGLSGNYDSRGNFNFVSASSQQFFDGTNGSTSDHNRCLMLVTSAAEDGTLTTVGPVKVSLQNNVVITSDDNQTVTVSFDAITGNLVVTLSATASGSKRKQRRQYIMDAGLIQSIVVNVLNASGTVVSTTPILAPTTPASTAVHFVDHLPKPLAIRIGSQKQT